MSDLTEKEIEAIKWAHEGNSLIGKVCDLAVRTLDEETSRRIAARYAQRAEERAQRAEASVQAEKELSTYWMERAVAAEDVAADNVSKVPQGIREFPWVLLANGNLDQSEAERAGRIMLEWLRRD